MSNKKRQRHLDKLARRDAHAKLAAERAGDPAYAQRTRTEDGRVVSASEDTMEIFRLQRELFVEKFGREPGPKDPVFFDLDASEPIEIDPARAKQQMAERLRGDMVESGVEPAVIDALIELGYMVSEDNRHLFSAEEVDAFSEAVSRHQR